MALDTVLRQLGGIARTSELLSMGYTREIIAAAVGYGRLVRVRKGWYATREVPASALEACRIGGRLACVSALAFHGILPGSGEAALHVEVPANASRLRLPGRGIVLHWTARPREYRSAGTNAGRNAGTRQAVSIATALGQSARCRGGRADGAGDSL